MKRITPLLLLLCMSTLAVAQQVSARLDSLMDYYNRRNMFNGSVLVVMKGQPLLSKGYGLRNAEGAVKNDENSIFQLGSITKQITAAVILKLQEQRKLSVNDRISKYFPSYPKGDSITIRQLLSHTSGIYNYTENGQWMQQEVTTPHNRAAMIATFSDKPLKFSPGMDMSYSNSNYMLLGYIIEDVTKMPYYQAVRKYIFEPLQMRHSGFDFVRLSDPDKAVGYSRPGQPAPSVDSSVSYAAGAAYSTTGDLAKWHEGLLHHKIIGKASAEEGFTPVKGRYAYGWIVDSIAGKRRMGHGGGIHGFNTNFERVPEDDAYVILLSNVSNGSLNVITDNIWKTLYFNAPIPKDKIKLKLEETVLKQYIGTYEMNENFDVVVSVQNGELHAFPKGQRDNLLYAESPDTFFTDDPDIQVKFVRDAAGNITGFNLYQRGQQVFFKKS